MALSHEYGFPYFSAWGAILRGAALSAQGQPDQGIIELRHGLDTHCATGAAVLHTYWAVLLAEALGGVGAVEEGLGVLDAALATIAASGEQRSKAELQRCTGELLQRLPGQTRSKDLTPEACFQHALDIARRQQARSLELRAAMSLSRLWRAQGRCPQARHLLEGVYSWFSEGFDTADLQAAKALLESCT